MMKLLLVIAYICNTANIMAQSQTGRLSIKPMVGVDHGVGSTDQFLR